jgi:hypothetical protein
MVQAAPPPPHKAKTGKKKSKDDKNKPSYGAARGRQIVVSLKSHAKNDEGIKQPEKKAEGESTLSAVSDHGKVAAPSPSITEKEKSTVAAVSKSQTKKDDKEDSMDIDKMATIPSTSSTT